MQKITVNLGKDTYNIEIARNLWQTLGKKVRHLSAAEKVAVITDKNVDALYGKSLEEQLKTEGFMVRRIAFTPGEMSKNLATLGKVYAALADFGLTRTDLIITLGGGVPGDLGGLAAATFLRGVAFMQVPTSLLAQIDSSVGGKVAVDLPEGKNLVGNFYQPKAVFIDPELLRTLPVRYLHDGLAEAIKYGAFGDAALFEKIAGFQDDAQLLANMEEIIFTCCTLKAQVVEKDEHDTGGRMVLNFGHTIGHAVEKCFKYGKYTHGEGVGLGMVRITQQTEKLGMTEKGTAERIAKVLAKYQLPTEFVLAPHQLLQAIGSDKKKSGNQLTIVVLDKIGQSHLQKIAFAALPKYVG